MEKQIRLFESFAGVGAVSSSLTRLGVPYELVGFSEIDRFAISSFCEVHKVEESLNYGDICSIDEKTLPDFDLYTFGSPCQDFSIAGKQKGSTWNCSDCSHEYNPLNVNHNSRENCPNCGSSNISKTRSSLIVESLRIIKYKKPNYLLMENVKNLVGKFKYSFDCVVAELVEYGYNCYWKVVNAKNQGIPQNRERVFLICIRKEIDDGGFEFPVDFDNGLRLKDFLEEEVAEKYYINKPWHFSTEADLLHDTNEIAQVDGVNYKALRTIGDPNLFCRCIDTMGGGQREPKVLTVGQVSNKGSQAGKVYCPEGVFPTICACTHGYAIGNIHKEYRVRKLTPKECWRLMGLNDGEFERAEKVNSDTQLYKQAGNSIVVDVLVGIFRNLFKL